MERYSSTGDPNLLHCNNCQTQLPPAGRFCPSCGASRPVTASPFGPTTLGGIFGGTFRIYGAGFLGIVIIVAIVQVPISLLGFWFDATLERAIGNLFQGFNSDWFLEQSNVPLFDPPLDPAGVLEIFRSVFYWIIILSFATWLGSVIMTGALIHGVSAQILDEPISAGGSYSFALGRFGAMLGASFLSGLAVFLVAITIIGIPFAIFLFVRWMFAMQTASLERCGPLAALARSYDLVQGNWWRVFGILLLIWILLLIANIIAGGILGFIPYAGPMVVAITFALVMIMAQTLLYHDLRVRRDGPAAYTPEVLAGELRSPSGL